MKSDEIDLRRSGAPSEKGRQRRATQLCQKRSRFTSSTTRHRALGAFELPKGGESIVTFTDLVTYLRARFGVEEGQTMAEYGVVLAVITGLVVIAIGLLSGAIATALDHVRSYL
jgi:Flp pilus assembly pilin Flp